MWTHVDVPVVYSSTARVLYRRANLNHLTRSNWRFDTVNVLLITMTIALILSEHSTPAVNTPSDDHHMDSR